MKLCSSCGKEKPENEFRKNRAQCKVCIAKYKKNYALINKERIKEYKSEYYKENKESILRKGKEYYLNNTDKVKQNSRSYFENNFQKVSEDHKRYYEKNKKHLLKKSKERLKRRLEEDSEFRAYFKIYHSVSELIRNLIKDNGARKTDSCLKHLDYSINDLMAYLESKFEDWMTWDNYGTYNKNHWDDNDSTTWKWQIDHIVPQSKLKYSSMEDDNFKKCWSLDNLRPLSAKENLLKGNRDGYISSSKAKNFK